MENKESMSKNQHREAWVYQMISSTGGGMSLDVLLLL